MLHGGHIFGPKVCLRAFYELLFVCLQLFGHGFIFVHFLKGKKAPNSLRFRCGILLVLVKITGATRCHDHIMSHPCGFNAPFLSSPAHHPGTRCQSTFQNLIPAQQLTAFGRNEFLHSSDGITLQFKFIFQVVVFDPLLAFAAGFPVCLSCFVATDMDIGGREDGHHFSDHILHENKGGVVAQTKLTLAFFGPNTTELWVCGNDLFGVAGHFNFRDDGDASFLGIGNQVFGIRLCVISSVGTGFSFFRVIPITVPPFLPAITGSPCSLRSEFRIFLHLYPPACRIGKVHVEGIDLVKTDQVNHFFDEAGRKEMP